MIFKVVVGDNNLYKVNLFVKSMGAIEKARETANSFCRMAVDKTGKYLDSEIATLYFLETANSLALPFFLEQLPGRLEAEMNTFLTPTRLRRENPTRAPEVIKLQIENRSSDIMYFGGVISHIEKKAQMYSTEKTPSPQLSETLERLAEGLRIKCEEFKD